MHKARRLTCSVHGDDFTIAGPKEELDCFDTTLESHYELKRGGRLGPGVDDDKETIVLNRVVHWTEEGVEYEADPRQVEKLFESLELDNANSVATPGQKCLPDQILAEVALEIAMQTPFRALGARASTCRPIGPTCSLRLKRSAVGWRTLLT